MTHEGPQGGGPAAWKGAIADACCPLRAGLRIAGPFLMVWTIAHLLDLSDAAAVRRRAGLRDAGPFRRLGGWAVDWRGERYVAAGSGAWERFSTRNRIGKRGRVCYGVRRIVG